ncbi:hypothetical protein VY88_25520 [Azospirillum thiophilum]|uniref:Lipoprotein n=1 Tax=Azospirillum thiophilum TaxID=528244 RepID=A0AAC8ZW21_9PROT|nr:hypothetical protein [Azospirillum thiophilum]ALG74933.1 hypothetical protein AL072_28440 [Azospirillum thiophilum]KJR62320.1 hypothetical protein VY88_25520 [Azospirillum thiophilum]
MSGTKASVFPTALAAACLLALPGCAGMSQAPDSDYRQAFEKALAGTRCDGDPVRSMWSAYDRWYAVASAIAGHPKTDEAMALLRQGDQFRTLGCPEVARASYRMLIRRFPEDGFAPLREAARASLQTLPPPVLPPSAMPPSAATPAPAGPTLVRPPATQT